MISAVYYKIFNYTPANDKKCKPLFSSKYINAQTPVLSGGYMSNMQSADMPWVKDEILSNAVNYLQQAKFDKNDIKYIQSMGIILPFLSGAEAVEFMKHSHVEIKFGKLASENTHAKYDFKNNSIIINELYKNTQSPAEVLAISEAVLHEAGHAKDGDGISSIQEEIECLSMNAIYHKALNKQFPNIFLNASSPIINNGVNVYEDLFFDNDVQKKRLIERLKQKYGYLPAGDINHSLSVLALKTKDLQL